MKKIAIVSDYAFQEDRIGSLDHFFWALDKALKDLAVEILWFHLASGEARHYEARGLKVIALPGNNVAQSFEDYCQQEAFHADLLITHFVPLFSNFYRHCRQLGFKRIIAVDHMSRPCTGWTLLRKVKLRLKGLVNGSSIDGVIAVCNYLKDEITRDFGNQMRKKISVIYNGVDATAYSQCPMATTHEKVRLLNISRLVPEKGIQHLFEAVSLLPKELRQQIEIVIAGDGYYRSHLEDLAESVPDCHISFLGNTPHLAEELAKSHLLVQPTHQEAFPLSFLEAFAAGRPVIATHTGGIPELLKSTCGRTFPLGDSAALAQILTDLMANPNEMSSMGHAASLLVRQQFSLEKMLAEHLKIIEEHLNLS